MEEAWYRVKRLLVQLAHFQKRKRVQRYGLPVLLTVAIFSFKSYYHSVLGDNSAFLMASFIVAASSWYGGLGPGIFATIITAAATYFFFLTRDSLTHPFIGDFIVLAVFLVEGLIISITNEARFEMENQKDEFIGFVSHELKNPLTAVMGFAGIIANRAKRAKDEKLEEYAQEITAQGNNVLNLVNDLLDITKIEIGKFDYVDKVFNPYELVQEIVGHQRVISKDRIIELRGKTKKVILGDKYRVSQVLINLISNALKYSPESKRIVVGLKETRTLICITVRDFGLGIPKDERKRIFERFYRVKDIMKKSEGLGLGLYITNQIVKHHRGKVWVESRIGKGSTFFVWLPIYGGI